MIKIDNSQYSIFNDLIEGIQVIDFEHKYFYVNAKVAEQANSTVDELTGEKMSDKFPGIENTEVFQAIDDCLKNRTNHRMLNEFVFPNGKVGYFELKFRPVEDGVLVMSVDVTDIKKAEKIISEHNDLLQEEVDRKTVEIRRQKVIIENERNNLQLSNEKLEDFGFIIAHDLKNPLMYIESLVNLVKENIDGNNEENTRRLDIVGNSARRCMSLVEDLFYYAKKSAVGLSTEKVSLNRLCESIKNEFENYENVQVDIFFDQEITCYLDKVSFKQALNNFVSNGIKYNDKETKKIILSFNPTEKKLDISDNGIGIAQNEFENVFKIFYRIEYDQFEEGKGVGMSIAKKILDRHDINITMSSSTVSGTTFTLDLTSVMA